MMICHDWGILGQDRIPRWPNENDARRIDVHIFTWKGTVVTCAKHYSVHVQEQLNQWWCEAKNCWVELSCDSGNRDHSLRAECLHRTDAVKLARSFIQLIRARNPDQPYLVNWSNETDEGY